MEVIKMELKKVTTETTQNYAKKEEITKKDLKKFTPYKWIVAASAGIVTLFYTSPKRSIHQIGVVFGCIEIAHNYNYTPLFHALNGAMDVLYYGTWIFGVGFVLSLLIGIFGIKDEEKNKKMQKVIKTMLIIGVILGVLTGILVFVLKQDLPAFFEGGVKKDLGWYLDSK